MYRLRMTDEQKAESGTTDERFKSFMRGRHTPGGSARVTVGGKTIEAIGRDNVSDMARNMGRLVERIDSLKVGVVSLGGGYDPGKDLVEAEITVKVEVDSKQPLLSAKEVEKKIAVRTKKFVPVKRG